MTDGTKGAAQAVNRVAGAPDAVSAGAERPGVATEPSPVGKGVRSIAVVGMAPAALNEIPRLSADTEIWTLNVGPQTICPRWDRHYEVHDFDWLRERRGDNVEAYLAWLQEPHEQPIYMLRPDPRIPASKQYPLEQVYPRYGRQMPDGRWNIYAESTVDWMLIAAINDLVNDAQREERPASGKLLCLGIDMGLKLEYQHQRKSAEFWLGVAMGMGIEVIVPQTSDLLQCAYPYGVDTYEPRAKKIQQRRMELVQQAEQAAAQEAAARDRKMALRGALDDVNYWTQGRY